MLFGGVFAFFGVFLCFFGVFVFRAPARFFGGVIFLKAYHTQTGNSRSAHAPVWAEPGSVVIVVSKKELKQNYGVPDWRRVASSEQRHCASWHRTPLTKPTARRDGAGGFMSHSSSSELINSKQKQK